MSLLLAYYGDDFTGSTDVMEVLQWAGLRTVLFLSAPTPDQLARFDNLRAFGIAGWSRSMSPGEMDKELAPALDKLRQSGAPLIHYKTCSTFDSSPEIGSIGKAIELGRALFGTRSVPILAGAPVLGRFTVFGNLFARSGLDTEPFRLDRHPTMRHHPITPMDESDIRVHLSRQTGLTIELFDVLHLEDSSPELRLNQMLAQEPGGILFDVLNDSHLRTIGKLIATMDRENAPLFLAGSSGIEYALAAHLEATGQMDAIRSHPAGKPLFGPTKQLAVITGSCSPVNDRQIARALDNGFSELRLDPARLVHPESSDREIHHSIVRALQLLENGANAIFHTSRGPDDPRISATLRQYEQMGFSERDIKLKNGRMLGPKLGKILRGILDKKTFQRVGVAGGDTSGFVARELGIEALEAIAPVAPGSPLCRVHAKNPLDGIEIIFKGGQVGRPEIWETILKGTARLEH
ncbi:MAG: four-carbon acid sugar kinase family protein [Verrucomicrobia bacterium]|nr:four-carbon acid sugar kinase family protein [Verrucomicrobiota bacterium]